MGANKLAFDRLKLAARTPYFPGEPESVSMVTACGQEHGKREVHVSPKQEICTPAPHQERGCFKARRSKRRDEDQRSAQTRRQTSLCKGPRPAYRLDETTFTYMDAA